MTNMAHEKPEYRFKMRHPRGPYHLPSIRDCIDYLIPALVRGVRNQT